MTDTIRRCIVTGEERPKAELIRFVVGPEGKVVPDVLNKLPGRGLWVSASRDAVKQAVAKNAFARAAKAKVKAEAGLETLVESQLRRRTLELLMLCRKAGLTASGFEKVRGWLEKEAVTVLIHAADAGVDGVEKLNRAMKDGVTVLRCFTVEELSDAFGAENRTHVAVKSGGLAENLAEQGRRLAGFVE